MITSIARSYTLASRQEFRFCRHWHVPRLEDFARSDTPAIVVEMKKLAGRQRSLLVTDCVGLSAQKENIGPSTEKPSISEFVVDDELVCAWATCGSRLQWSCSS